MEKLIKSNNYKPQLLAGVFFLGTAVMLGAFGAHALKQHLSEKYLETFQTGVTYQYYHGLALLFLGLLSKQFTSLNTNLSFYSFSVGILLFCFNCYLYATTQTKIFAMIVPFGGILFIIGWCGLFYQLYRKIQ